MPDQEVPGLSLEESRRARAAARGRVLPVTAPAAPAEDIANDPRFNTALDPEELRTFAEWKRQHAPNDSGFDYDLRGAFKAGLTPDPVSGHWPDTFKKPNHPTFSDQSRYASLMPDRAGTWAVDGSTFVPPASRGAQPPARSGVALGVAPRRSAAVAQGSAGAVGLTLAESRAARASRGAPARDPLSFVRDFDVNVSGESGPGSLVEAAPRRASTPDEIAARQAQFGRGGSRDRWNDEPRGLTRNLVVGAGDVLGESASNLYHGVVDPIAQRVAEKERDAPGVINARAARSFAESHPAAGPRMLPPEPSAFDEVVKDVKAVGNAAMGAGVAVAAPWLAPVQIADRESGADLLPRWHEGSQRVAEAIVPRSMPGSYADRAIPERARAAAVDATAFGVENLPFVGLHAAVKGVGGEIAARRMGPTDASALAERARAPEIRTGVVAPEPAVPTPAPPIDAAGPSPAAGGNIAAKLQGMAKPVGLDARLAKAGLDLPRAFDAALRQRTGELDVLRPADRAFVDSLVTEWNRAKSFPKRPELLDAVKAKINPPEPTLGFGEAAAPASMDVPNIRTSAPRGVSLAESRAARDRAAPEAAGSPPPTPRPESRPVGAQPNAAPAAQPDVAALVRRAEEIRASVPGAYSKGDAMRRAQAEAARPAAVPPLRRFAASDGGGAVGDAAPPEPVDASPAPRRAIVTDQGADVIDAPNSPVQRIPVESIEVDPALQFKRVTDERTGTGKRLRDVSSFDPEKGGVVAVWRDPATGSTKIVNGFHRLDLARRSGAGAIDARFIDAANATEARAKGALLNIAEGQGSPLDVAAFLRDRGLRGEDARGFLREHDVPLTSATARDGLALSRLEDGLFDQYARGELREPTAAAIADSGLDGAGQRALADAVRAKNVDPAEIPALARRVQGAETTTRTTASLFGDVTEGRNLFALEAKIETQLVRDLARDKRLFGGAARNAGTLERGGNVIDVGRSSDIAARSAQVADVVQRLSGVRGPVAEAIGRAARAVESGEATLTDAIARARIDAEAAVRAELGSRAAGGDAPGATARPRAPGLFESGAFDPEPSERFGNRGERGSLGIGRGGDGPTGEAAAAAARAVAAVARGVSGFASKSVGRSIDFIRRQYGEAGAELARRIQDVQTDTRARAGRDIQELNAAAKEIPALRRAGVSHRLRALVEGRETPKGPAEAKLVDTVRAIFERVAEFSNESGVRIDDSRTGPRPVPTGWAEYFPQVLKGEIREALRRGDPATIAKLEELNVGAGKAFATAEEMAAELQRFYERRPESFHPGTELPRRFHYPDAWVDPDGLHTVLSYVERAYQNAAEHRWFEYRANESGAKGQGVLGDLYARIEREFGAGDAAEAKTLTERILGRHVEDASRTARVWRKLQGAEGLLTSARLFAGNVRLPFQQMTQFRNLVTLVGERRALQALARTVTRYGAARDLAVREGAVRPESTVARMLGNEDVAGRALRTGHGVVSVLSKPIAMSDEFWRTVASEAAPGHAADLVGALEGANGRASRIAAGTLEKLDMTPAEIAEFKSGDVSERTMTKFRQRSVAHSQVETGASERPVFMTRPGLQWAGRLKSFGIGDARFAVRFALDEAAHGNLAPMGRYLLWTVTTGEALNAAYSTVFGPRPGRPTVDEIVEKKDLGLLRDRLVDDLQAASFFGLLGSVGLDAVPDKEGKSGLANAVEHLVTPPIVDTAKAVGRAYDRAVRPERGDPNEERVSALWQLVRSQVAAVKQGQRVREMATPEGIDDVGNKTMHGAPGYRVAPQDRPEYLRQLRERQELLRSLEAGAR